MSVASVKSSEGASSSACGHDEQNRALESSDRHDQESNKPELLTRKRQLQGGFECVFVEEPPKQVQTECAICLCVLKDPYLVDCCCNSFCQSCIKPIQEDEKPCPLCNMKFTTCIPDKRLKRTLNEMKVYCPHKESGCQWTDELVKLSQHLNVGGSEEFKGCLFVLIECTFCHENTKRKELKEHKAEKCPQRPYSCDYCNNYESTCEDVTTNHWPICPSRPVPCPNHCGVYPEYKQLDKHLAKQCVLAIIKCPFEYAGCTGEFQRKDVEVHLSEKLAHHMSLQAISHKLQLEAYQNQVAQLKQQIETLTVANEQLTEGRKKTHDHVTEIETQLKQSIEQLHEENQQLRRQIEQHRVEKLKQSKQLHEENQQLRRQIEQHGVEKLKQNKQLHEENQQLRHQIEQHGVEIATKLKLSIEQLHQENQQLKCQLEHHGIERHKLSIELHQENQQLRCQIEQHGVQKLNLSIKQLHEENRQLRRQIEQHGVEMADLRGHTSLAHRSYQDVRSEIASCKSEIALCKTDMIMLHSHIGLLPVEVTLREFRKNRRDKVVCISNPFYTHAHGYKLCLAVYPNGRAEGSDTHVSVGIYLMQGEFDDKLDWPFTGSIIIELLPNNQQEFAPRGILPHKTRTITVKFTDDMRNNAGDRVVGKEVADIGRGWTKFVSHTNVEQRYLKDDTLIFKISKM